MPHLIYILFTFALGACVGSFLNVVVWRLPRVEPVENEGLLRGFFRSMHALSEPPSHCPKCNKLLKWYDNIPVIGWIKLGGKCRFCRSPISKRYPIVEAICGLMFVGYYAAFFIYQVGPCSHVNSAGVIRHPILLITYHWWLYGLYMILLSGLLAASLIDAELFIIPIEIPWAIVPVALAAHAWFARPDGPGSLMVGPLPGALAAGAAVGTIFSVLMVHLKVFPRSFAEGDPLLEVERQELEKQRLASGKKPGNAKQQVEDREILDAEREWSPREIRREIRKEMLFLLPPMMLGLGFVLACWRVEPVGQWWGGVLQHAWLAGLLGSVLGGLVGGATIWFTRVLGSYGFGRQAMGMGDVDLMVAVGAVLGPGPAVVTFFLAPFFGIAFALYMWFMRQKRELPYGPYLSLAAGFVMLFYCPIAAYFAPGLSNLGWIVERALQGG